MNKDNILNLDNLEEELEEEILDEEEVDMKKEKEDVYDDFKTDISELEDMMLSSDRDPMKGKFSLPLIPLRNKVLAPHMVILLFVGRKASINLLEKHKDGSVFFVLQKDPDIDSPVADDLYSIGVIGKILELVYMKDGTIKVLVQGQSKAVIEKLEGKFEDEQGIQAYVRAISDKYDIDESVESALRKQLKKAFVTYTKLKSQYSSEFVNLIESAKDLVSFIDLITMNVDLMPENKQLLLEEDSVMNKVEHLLAMLETEIEKIRLADKIGKNVKDQVVKSQKEFLLRAQLDAIKKELGDGDSLDDEMDQYQEKLDKIKFTKEAKEKVQKEIKKLRSMNSMSAEAGVIRNYLEWVFALPWGVSKKTNKDLKKAEKILNQNHYGLKKIKERIYEMLALQARNAQLQGSVLCFYGPPGVGKTSLAKSIAQATGREFVRISLGGLHDEAELRGHRSTYIGAKPGRFIQAMRNVKSDNPVILLDEIGEIGQDWRGNPAAALLEILDKEQNKDFRDNFLELGWDLSKALFIGTTNSLDLSPALVDRLDIVYLSGYTNDEKIRIAKEHLIPMQIKENGLKEDELTIEDSALDVLINNYTKEAGVRNLERQIGTLARKSLRKLLLDKDLKHINVAGDNVKTFLGVEKYKSDKKEIKDRVGVTAGLAWTQYGGEVLYVEAVTFPGTGKVNITGKLGDTMKESVQAALSFVKYKAKEYGIDHEKFEKTDLHVHLPEGAIPKDGPSAGIALTTSIVSAFTGKKVRGDVAMTGEISLKIGVLPIGGLKEKLLAALRNDMKTVYIPHDNKKDLEDLEDISFDGLEIVTVNHVEEFLDKILI